MNLARGFSKAVERFSMPAKELFRRACSTVWASWESRLTFFSVSASILEFCEGGLDKVLWG